jgi:hypothetical protein
MIAEKWTTAGCPDLTMPPRSGAHLRRGFIATKVGYFRGGENPETVKFANALRSPIDISAKMPDNL